jgi:PAS domain S-box-containing protein
VVFITAIKGDKESRIRALESGAEAFLSKPIDESELTAQIRAMLKINTANREKRNEKERLAALVEEQTREIKQNHLDTLTLLDDLKNENEARKKIESELRKSEEKYRTIFENIQDVFYQTDLAGTIIEMSPSIIHLCEFDRNELIGNPVTLLYYNPNERGVLVNAILRNGELWDYELELKTKSGRVKIVSINARLIKDKEGKPTHIDGAIRDITTRKNVEKELNKLQIAIENSEVSFVITDKEGTIEYANPYFTALTGYTKEEYTGANPSVLNSGHHPEAFYRELWETIKSGKTWEGEFYNRKKNGEFYWENAIISPVVDAKNEITHFVAIKTDISAVKKANEELLIARDHAQESDRLKSAFLANMSHEIRTPMNGILGFAELLKMPGLTGEQQQEYIGIIKKSGDRMLNIINNIVDISKIESGQMSLNITETNINEPIEFVYNFFEPEAKAKGVELLITHKLPADQAVIETDREKIYAILTNLVKNAIKFSDCGTISIGYHLKGEFLEFYVKDKGIGIPYARQHAIFERFVQADISDKRAFQGAGLGLSISKAYAEMLGGKIWVESMEGESSAFYFSIPYKTKKEQNAGVWYVDPAGINFKKDLKLKVLVVEDDEISQQLVTLAVGKISKEILSVNSGFDAVEVCRKTPDIDLILMDIKMPVMDGYEATQQIRQFNKDAVIIAQTAFGLSGDKEKALAAGCNGYISKPLNIALLTTLIQKHFNMY